MESTDPGRARAVKRNEEVLNEEEPDPKDQWAAYRKRTAAVAEVDKVPELEPGDYFWVDLSRHLAPAIPPDGAYPVPSEAREIFERGMGYQRILHPENQRFALEMLSEIWVGRAEGSAVKPTKDKEPKGKRRRRATGSP